MLGATWRAQASALGGSRPGLCAVSREKTRLAPAPEAATTAQSVPAFPCNAHIAFEPSCPCMGAQPSMPRRPAPPHPAHEHLQWQSAAVLSLHFHVITHVCQSACLKPNCCQRAKGVRSLFARQPTGSQWASLSSRLLQCTPDHSARCCQRLTLPRIWEVAQPNTPHNATLA